MTKKQDMLTESQIAIVSGNVMFTANILLKKICFENIIKFVFFFLYQFNNSYGNEFTLNKKNHK